LKGLSPSTLSRAVPSIDVAAESTTPVRFARPPECYDRRLYHAHWLHDPASTFCLSARSLRFSSRRPGGAHMRSPSTSSRGLGPASERTHIRYQLHSVSPVGVPALRWSVQGSCIPLAYPAPRLVSPRFPPRGLTPSGFDYPSGCRRVGVAASSALPVPCRSFPSGNASGILRLQRFPPRGLPRQVVPAAVPSCRCPVFTVFLPSGGRSLSPASAWRPWRFPHLRRFSSFGLLCLAGLPAGQLPS
jgi:hypothetical protein